jgi:hypothetical protein
MFFVVIISISAFVTLVYIYITAASINERAFTVTLDGEQGTQQISSEDIIYEERVRAEGLADDMVINDELPKISIVNRSDVVGLAASLRILLETDGYEVIEVTNDLDASVNDTVILFDPDYSEQVLELSELLEVTLLSAYRPDEVPQSQVTILLGNDFENTLE